MIVLVSIFVLTTVKSKTTPVPANQERPNLEKPCGERTPKIARTYKLRSLRPWLRPAYAPPERHWYSPILNVLGIGKSLASRSILPDPQYSSADISSYAKGEFGENRPLPVGMTTRLKQIFSDIEQPLIDEESQAEKDWNVWKTLNPNAEIEEQNTKEQQIRFRGLGARKLSRFSLGDDLGLNVGEVGLQADRCDSCWAFASVDAMQISRQLSAKRLQKPIVDGNYSADTDELVNCMVPDPKEYCRINWPGTAFSYFVDYGLPLLRSKEKDIPKKCDSKTRVKAATWNYVSSTPYKVAAPDDIKRALVTYGPVTSLILYEDCFYLYGGDGYKHEQFLEPFVPSGTFNEEEFNNGDRAPGDEGFRNDTHVVLIIGWDDKKDGGAWLVKNSYGPKWGDDGFGWIKYGSNNIGQWAAYVVPDPAEEERMSNLSKRKNQ
jgi:Papain family cysteine protease